LSNTAVILTGTDDLILTDPD